jgi:very-short-patch-repair endonuclease
VVEGIPCTTYERTLLDSAARLGRGQLARGLDEGLVSNRATNPSVDALIARLRPARGRRRAGLRRLAYERAPESHHSDSAPEIALLAAVRAAGLPDPVPQFRVEIDGEHFDIDAAYPDVRVGIEYLGWDPHRTKTKFDADHRRDRLLTLDGWSVLYFTSASSADEIVEHIERLRARSPKG